MKIAIILQISILISFTVAYKTPKERQLLYKESGSNLLSSSKLNNGRILEKERNLGMFGPGDDEIVKIKAKKDMLKKKIDMDNGKIFEYEKIRNFLIFKMILVT